MKLFAKFRSILALLTLWASPAHANSLSQVHSWAVFYGDSAPLKNLQKPDLLVLEPDQPWDPTTIRRPGQIILAYLSLGEVNHSRRYYPELAEATGSLLGKDPNWPEASLVDPRSSVWRSMVLDRIAPSLFALGYDGFFLDTLDVGSYLQAKGKYPGADRAMAKLVLGLKQRFPQAILLSNGGLSLLPETAKALSGLAVESVFTDYQFKPAKYREREARAALARQEELGALGTRYGLPVFVIEYAKDPDMRKRVAAKAEAAGFIPFVTTIGLDSLGEDP